MAESRAELHALRHKALCIETAMFLAGFSIRARDGLPLRASYADERHAHPFVCHYCRECSFPCTFISTDRGRDVHREQKYRIGGKRRTRSSNCKWLCSTTFSLVSILPTFSSGAVPVSLCFDSSREPSSGDPLRSRYAEDLATKLEAFAAVMRIEPGLAGVRFLPCMTRPVSQWPLPPFPGSGTIQCS